MGWKGCLGFVKINDNFCLSRKSTVCKFKFLLTKLLFKAVICMYNLFTSLLGVHSQMVCASPFLEHGKRFLGFTYLGYCNCVRKRWVGWFSLHMLWFKALATGLDIVRPLIILLGCLKLHWEEWLCTLQVPVFVYMFWWNPSYRVHKERMKLVLFNQNHSIIHLETEI